LRVRFDLGQALERWEFSPKERKPAKRKAKTCKSIKTANGEEELALAREGFFVLKERERSFFPLTKFMIYFLLVTFIVFFFFFKKRRLLVVKT
jgi:hypothetical protein